MPACLPLASAAHAHPRPRPELRISPSFRPRFRAGLPGSSGRAAPARSAETAPIPEPREGATSGPQRAPGCPQPRAPHRTRARAAPPGISPFHAFPKEKTKSQNPRKHGPGGGCANTSPALRFASRARGSQGRAPGPGSSRDTPGRARTPQVGAKLGRLAAGAAPGPGVDVGQNKMQKENPATKQQKTLKWGWGGSEGSALSF